MNLCAHTHIHTYTHTHTHTHTHLSQGFPSGSAVKNLREMQKTQVQFLGQEDPLEKEMATNSSTLAWRIPGMEEPGGLLFMGSHRVGHD